MQIDITVSKVGLKRPPSDLRRLEAWGIFASALMASPIPSNWRSCCRKVGCPEAVVEEQPSIPNSDIISASEVWAHFDDENEHFVRTHNAWQRLGTRKSAGQAPADGLVTFGGRRG
jgi:hypothetical protein